MLSEVEKEVEDWRRLPTYANDLLASYGISLIVSRICRMFSFTGTHMWDTNGINCLLLLTSLNYLLPVLRPLPHNDLSILKAIR